MSLFGALSSGVSGLTAQSSAMGAISDNITNVSTVGYKSTRVDFQTLVTKQTSSTFYSAGGVQSTPRQDTGVQGLLQASTSSTDISISGSGYFVVNEAAKPTIANQYLFTRAGSFFQDNEGFLRNTSGFYLQGWPTDANGVVVPANSSLGIANQNIISTDYLSTVNLNRVGGTATATSTIAIGANLPANDTEGTTHKTDIQFFDTLGNASTMSFVYAKGARENTWDLNIRPPAGTGSINIYDKSLPTAKIFDSAAQLEFNIPTALGDSTRRPGDAATVIIDGTTYEFDTLGSEPSNGIAEVNTLTVAGSAVGDIYNVNIFGPGTASGATVSYTVPAGPPSVTAIAASIVSAINSDATVSPFVTATSALGVVTITSDRAGYPMNVATTVTGTGTGTFAKAITTVNSGRPGMSNGVAQIDSVTIGGTIEVGDTFTATVNGNTISVVATDTTVATTAKLLAAAINASSAVNTKVTAVPVTGTGVVEITSDRLGYPVTYTVSTTNVTAGAATETIAKASITANSGNIVVDTSTNTSLSQDVASLVASVVNYDSNYHEATTSTSGDLTNGRIAVSPDSTTTIIFRDNGLGDITIDPTGLLDSTGVAVTKQTSAVTAQKPSTDYTDEIHFKFSADISAGATITINGNVYTANGAGNSGFAVGTNLATTLTNLENAIELVDSNFSAGGSRVHLRAANMNINTPPSNNTLVLKSLKSGSYDVIFPDSGTLGAIVTSPDTIASEIVTYTSTIIPKTVAVDTAQAIEFTSDGLPKTINIDKLEVLGYASGAADMDDSPTNAKKMAIDFGNLLEANGMTQFGASFTPTFITQNGSRFGTFAGVTIESDGLVTALFDNGETRTIFRLPIATFVNVNQLEGASGNVWNATERSGDSTLREADNGPAGAVVQGALEASTVDIGEEFTKLIVVQRAYSASAKIIKTADEMLAELMRIKN